MILLTGATGTIGREVVRRLPTGTAVRIMTRDPARSAALGGTAEIVPGDYDDERSLARALDGVERALLVTTDPAAPQDARFLRVARQAGVRHVVKLSAAAVADPLADDAITRWQRANERLLRESGLAWTMLRPRAFMSNTLSWAASVRSERVVRALYGDSPNACVDPRDVAEAAVRALTEHGHEGAAPILTGPEPITAMQQTAVLAELLGRPLRFEELGPERARAGLLTRYPEAVVEALLQSAERQLAGAKAAVDDTVPAATGRPARSFRVWAQDHLAAFGSQAASSADG